MTSIIKQISTGRVLACTSQVTTSKLLGIPLISLRRGAQGNGFVIVDMCYTLYPDSTKELDDE